MNQNVRHLRAICVYVIVGIQHCKCSLFSEYYNRIPFLEFYVTSTNLLIYHNITKFERTIKSLTSEIEFERNINLKLELYFKNIELTDFRTKFYICEENITRDQSKSIKKYFDPVEGFILFKQNSSFVKGYIRDYFFYGTVYVDNIVYYIEDVRNYPEIYYKSNKLDKNAVIFKENLPNTPFNENRSKRVWRHIDFSINNERELFKSIIGNGKVCSLFVLMDNSFLTKIHNGNLRAAVAQILNSLEEANGLFRSTDFDDDGYPDNIGFMIKYFIVLQSEESSMNLFPKYSKSSVDGKAYLKIFSRYTLLNEVCLGISFTGHTFSDNILGVSYTAEPTYDNYFKYSIGGICDRPYKFQAGKNLNAIAISAKLKSGNVVPQFIFDLCVAHELGHSFGSNHDISVECQGHLMSAHAPQEDKRKHFMFSSCSKEIILKTIVSKGHCFENYEGSFCGNGIVEAEEICDCGPIRDCMSLDACCVPRGRENSCKLNKKAGIDCHPSQGPCCSSKCKYNDLSNFDLDCRNFEKSCPCQGSKTCKCGVEGQCTRSVCSSKECTRILLIECDCPLNVNQKKCVTCCLFNGSCLSSRTVSEMLINDNKSLMPMLKLHKNLYEKKSNKFGHYQNFCQDSFCVELTFRESNPSEYCLIYGQVGICNEHLVCSVPRPKRIFPKLQVFSESYIKKCTPFTLIVICNFVIIFHI